MMLKMIKKGMLAALLFCAVGFGASAQVAVKTNLLYDATATANAGIEFALARKWSFDLSGNLNAWYMGDQTWKHWMAQPEVRYWFCDRFAGHFVGAHVLGGQFNIGNFNRDVRFIGGTFEQGRRYQGWGAGLGVAYGFAWVLGRHLNLEAEIGAGWVHTWYDEYECRDCERLAVPDLEHDYLGPTKAALNLVYVF